ncbi:outer membrane porin, OprD family, partial [Pseudomonas syringae]
MERIHRAAPFVAGFCGLLIAQQSFGEGFLEDSKASILAHNFFSNADNRSGAADPNYTQEWGQGFMLHYQSGYTPGTVGFGVDALGPVGIRLAPRKGR